LKTIIETFTNPKEKSGLTETFLSPSKSIINAAQRHPSPSEKERG
jgi:hypothetical protein